MIQASVTAQGAEDLWAAYLGLPLPAAVILNTTEPRFFSCNLGIVMRCWSHALQVAELTG